GRQDRLPGARKDRGRREPGGREGGDPQDRARRAFHGGAAPGGLEGVPRDRRLPRALRADRAPGRDVRDRQHAPHGDQRADARDRGHEGARRDGGDDPPHVRGRGGGDRRRGRRRGQRARGRDRRRG